ncbi:uncharacterized protein LOC126840519 [Adelges cooleyi]|uniref:uncharacterized protein LOC126840519 n=1 Tax=Adelges cooleyi TaxID=133065 RepID=UPI00217F7321|nr:uncharacterized protein LOC126840519 [Adelges cooleyi]
MSMLIAFTFGDLNIKPVFRPNLPSGQYKLIFRAVYKCSTTNLNETIQLNLHITKTSEHDTSYVGNITLLEPLTDEFDINVNMAVMDKIGGWKDNAYVYTSKKGCTSIKGFYGVTFSTFLGLEHVECPVGKGIYNVLYDTKNYEKGNFPKIFFYGKTTSS